MTNSKVRSYTSLLKYYIHDSIDALRLELTGELVENDLRELNGCWNTAKTTLGTRKLLLDLRKLKTVDDAGRQWLDSMAAQGASFLPEGRLHLQPAGQCYAADHSLRKNHLLGKLVGLCRGVRVSPIKSSTQAQ